MFIKGTWHLIFACRAPQETLVSKAFRDHVGRLVSWWVFFQFVWFGRIFFLPPSSISVRLQGAIRGTGHRSPRAWQRSRGRGTTSEPPESICRKPRVRGSCLPWRRSCHYDRCMDHSSYTEIFLFLEFLRFYMGHNNCTVRACVFGLAFWNSFLLATVNTMSVLLKSSKEI